MDMNRDTDTKQRNIIQDPEDENVKKSNDDEFGSIMRFYRNSTIFITGVTGFLGHVLLFKLLSSVDIRVIYVLMRNKRNETASERLHKMFNENIFDKLKCEKPASLEKVQIIQGDCSEPNLGISEADRKLLQAEVNVIFHVAATVRFDESLRRAVNVNVRSTQVLLDIASNMQNLKAFIHVSTAFSFCAGRRVIEEKLYDPPLDASCLIEVVKLLSEDVINHVTPALLRDHPNTYVFTKTIAEGLFSTESLNLPIAIFRPAIVTSTAKEPTPGWINNCYNLTGVIAASGLGLMRTLHVNKHCKANIVPCDYSINALIALAWYIAKHWHLEAKPKGKTSENSTFRDKIPIFIYGSAGTTNSITWSQVLHRLEIADRTIPFYQSLWAYSLCLNKYSFMNKMCMLFLHLLPAYIVDTIGAICGKRYNLIESYRKIHKLSNVISYFSTRDWVLLNNNVRKMWNTLTDDDKVDFYFDLETIDWDEYFRHYVAGVRQHLLNDPPDTIPKAIKRRRTLILVHYAFIILIMCILMFCLNIVLHYSS